MNDKLSFVVSAGHGEYMLEDVQVIEHSMVTASREDATVEVLRAALSGDFSDIAGWDDAQMTGDTVVTVNGNDIDLDWEWLVGWYGPREWIEAEFERLLGDVMAGPTGADDDTFDYWPSGVRYCQQIADQLGGDWRQKVDNAARVAITTRRSEFIDELFNSCRLDTDDK